MAVHGLIDGGATERPAPPTLYEWAGGEQAFRRLIDAFYDRAEKDELISPYFPGGVHEAHRAHVAAWWREVFGGPTEYSDELGGYDHMVARHRDLGITREAQARFVSLMSLAADDAGLPADPEFRSALLAYVRVGDAARLRELAAWRRRRRACAGPELGLGRSAAVQSVTLWPTRKNSPTGSAMPSGSAVTAVTERKMFGGVAWMVERQHGLRGRSARI